MEEEEEEAVDAALVVAGVAVVTAVAGRYPRSLYPRTEAIHIDLNVFNKDTNNLAPGCVSGVYFSMFSRAFVWPYKAVRIGPGGFVIPRCVAWDMKPEEERSYASMMTSTTLLGSRSKVPIREYTLPLSSSTSVVEVAVVMEVEEEEDEEDGALKTGTLAILPPVPVNPTTDDDDDVNAGGADNEDEEEEEVEEEEEEELVVV